MSTPPRFFRLSASFLPRERGLVTFMNPYSWLVNRNRGTSDLHDFEIYADGISLVWLYNVLCRTSIRRFAFDFSSVAGKVFADAEARGRTIFLVGGKDGVARDAAEVIRRRHPRLSIVGTRAGYFASKSEYRGALAAAAHANVVVAGMGAPAQEKFIADLWGQGWRGTGYTCGGFLDQIIGTDGDYFPAWSDRFHLRWLYRLYKEPRRLWKRYFLDYPRFLGVFVADWYRTRGGSR